MRKVLLSDPELGKNFNFSEIPFNFLEKDLSITKVVPGANPDERIVHATIAHPPRLLGNPRY